MKSFIILVVCALVATSGAQDWDSLRVTFGIPFPGTGSSSTDSSKGVNGNGLSSKIFIRQPLTQEEATGNWTRLNPSADCTNGGLFNGVQLYDKSNPLAIVLLFDVQGTIAGIQTFFPKSEALSNTGPLFRYDLVPMFNNVTQDGVDYFVLTFYFVEPSTICSVGRDDSSLNSEGTGTGLYIQNGTSPSQIVSVPLNRDDNVNNGFSMNNCGSSMGWHNFYETEKWSDTDCTTINPIFLLYDNSKNLHGFGVAVRGNFSSKAYEHPSALATAVLAGSSDGSYPVCSTAMVNTFKVGTAHIYFTDDAQDFSCPYSSYRGVGHVLVNYLQNFNLGIKAAFSRAWNCGITIFTGCGEEENGA